MIRGVTLRGGEFPVPGGMQVEIKRPLVRDTITSRCVWWRGRGGVPGEPGWPRSADAPEETVFARLPGLHSLRGQCPGGASCKLQACSQGHLLDHGLRQWRDTSFLPKRSWLTLDSAGRLAHLLLEPLGRPGHPPFCVPILQEALSSHIPVLWSRLRLTTFW